MSMLLTFPPPAFSTLRLEFGIRFGVQERKESPLFSLVDMSTSLALSLQPE